MSSKYWRRSCSHLKSSKTYHFSTESEILEPSRWPKGPRDRERVVLLHPKRHKTSWSWVLRVSSFGEFDVHQFLMKCSNTSNGGTVIISIFIKFNTSRQSNLAVKKKPLIDECAIKTSISNGCSLPCLMTRDGMIP